MLERISAAKGENCDCGVGKVTVGMNRLCFLCNDDNHGQVWLKIILPYWNGAVAKESTLMLQSFVHTL